MRVRNPRLPGDVCKGAIAIVVIEDVGCAIVIVGMAVGSKARTLFPTVAVGLEGPVEIASHEQIEFAIVVVIEETRARAPATCSYSGLVCDVSECAVPVAQVPNSSA